MGLTSALFGGKLRIALVALVLVAAGVGGAYVTGVIGAPSVDRVDNRFAGVNETETVIETDLYVSNPNPLSANLSGLEVDYGVEMNGIRMATGEKEGVAIGRGTSAVPLRTTLENERIPEWWVSHIQNGEHTDLVVDANVSSETLGRTFEAPEITRSIDTDLLSAFNSTETREIDADSPVVSDPVLYVNETSAEWGESTGERTALELTFVVHNPKPYPVAVSELGYDISMNDVDVGEGTTNSEYVIPPQSTETIEATTYIQNDKLDEWWVSHLERDQTTDLRIDFYANLDAGGTTLRVPLDPLTYEKTFETDIFGNKAASEGNETATQTATETATTTSTATATETSTDTATATTTTTETTTTATTTTTTTTTTSDGGTTTTDDGLL
ncbi:LEA type 2 family protein [Haloferax sp. ATB1]|uniref:LEA type 2 family protein n=1 Tax=Haloferax sp. ATB1 TaxID=1508454 RepID=UPI0005B21A6E|nr:LEA type 2 family protein [Haloferax sp. ATB1]